jgi:hypothetical protein
MLGLAACGREDAPGTATAEDGNDVVFEDERQVDLLGDAAPERVEVTATGTRYDSLRVRVAIHGQADSLLYVDSWHSDFYFKYDFLEGKADTTVQRIVRGHLAALLRDTAFAPPGARVPDPEAVRYHIAEYSWRSSAGVPDTVPLPPGAYEQIEQYLVPEADVALLVAELAQRPSFTYYAGGEVVYTIAWSDRERRFIRIQACC